MRKVILGAASVFALSAGSAMAAESVQIEVSGTLDQECSLDFSAGSVFNSINLEQTGPNNPEELEITCNYGGNATVEFESENGGTLNNISPWNGGETLSYLFNVLGTGGTFVVPAFAQNYDFAGGPLSIDWGGLDANTTEVALLGINLQEVATVAGTYTDTITVTITFP